VVAHFRDYRAAIDRKDFAAAETAATAALEASEAANGSRTAVLALNLALLRLSLAQPDRALEPAQRAHELASNDRDSGVDGLLASLTLGRAELAADLEAGVERVSSAVADAEKRKAFLAEAYTATVALGEWALANEAYDTARAAWIAAERLAPAGSPDPGLGLGRARLNQGVAIVLAGINRPRNPSSRNSLTVTASNAAHEADAAFSEAQRLLRSYAFPSEAGEALSIGQVLYAQAMAWQGALRARLRSQDEELREESGMQVDPPQRPGMPVPCSYETDIDALGYPPNAVETLGAGAVVIHTRFDDSGNVLRRDVAAGVPTGLFVDATRRQLPGLRSERAAGSPPDCEASGSRYDVVLYVLY
jgi:hypothetical protein